MKILPLIAYAVLTLPLAGCSSSSRSSYNSGVDASVAQSSVGILDAEKVSKKNSKIAASVVQMVSMESIDMNGQVGVRQSRCTGTLIAENVVLTAGHCVTALIGKKIFAAIIDAGTPEFHSQGTPSLVVGQELDEGAASAVEVAVPPGFKSSDGFTTPDIALVRLARPLARPTVKVKIDTIGLSAVGNRVVAMGYGVSAFEAMGADGAPASPVRDGLHKKTFVVVDRARVDWAEGHKSSDSFFLAADAGEDSGNICQGDSGGPVLAKTDGQIYILGVIARTDGNCTGFSASTSVKAHAAWIAGQVSKWGAALF